MQINDVERYLPHRPPFVMIDSISYDAADASRASAGFHIRQDNVLVRDGKLTAGGLVENMAQAAGAATGVRTTAGGETPGLGFIGALKNLKVDALPGVGETLRTDVTFVHQVMNALIVEARVSSDSKPLASCELKIFLQS
jgi:predicted hotdog family 3-hydroxylacyl-ACP dehydratase